MIYFRAQVVRWPHVRCYRKNVLEASYVKLSMDGAAYLRKIDLNIYKSYQQLLKALDNMFKCSIGKFLLSLCSNLMFKIELHEINP